MKSVITGILACLLSMTAAVAQEPSADQPRQPRGRLAYMVSTSIPDGLENPVKVMTGKDVVEVMLSKRSASEPVKIPADGNVRIVREVPDPADASKRAYLTLAQAAIPESVSNALVILIPIAKKPGSDLIFRTEIQDLAAFTGGDFLYLNLTNLDLKVELGKDTLAIKPGQTRIFDAPNLTKATNVATRYSYFHPVKKDWKMLSASTIVLRSTRREICIFSWDERLERVDYHGIVFPVAP
jgi:hypothetical protein